MFYNFIYDHEVTTLYVYDRFLDLSESLNRNFDDNDASSNEIPTNRGSDYKRTVAAERNSETWTQYLTIMSGYKTIDGFLDAVANINDDDLAECISVDAHISYAKVSALLDSLTILSQIDDIDDMATFLYMYMNWYLDTYDYDGDKNRKDYASAVLQYILQGETKIPDFCANFVQHRKKAPPSVRSINAEKYYKIIQGSFGIINLSGDTDAIFDDNLSDDQSMGDTLKVTELAKLDHFGNYLYTGFYQHLFK